DGLRPPPAAGRGEEARGAGGGGGRRLARLLLPRPRPAARPRDEGRPALRRGARRRLTRLRAAALLVAVITAFLAAPAPAQEKPSPPRGPVAWTSKADSVPAEYKIDAALVETDAAGGTRISGVETVTWTNTSKDSVRVLYFHTYANAF